MSTLLALFWSFCQIGYTSFGGLSMLPLINSEMTTHGWMTAEEVADIIAIAEITPGPLGLNCATFAGIRVAGVAGAAAANLGVLMPTLTLCALAALFLEKFKRSAVLQNVMFGVRPVCLGLICAIILSMGQTNYLPENGIALRAVAVGAAALTAALRFRWSIPRVIIGAAILGLLLM